MATGSASVLDLLPKTDSKGGVSRLDGVLPEWLHGNPLFTAGFGLAILGSGLSLAKTSSTHVMEFCKRRLVQTLEVTSRDPAYPWLMSWLGEAKQGLAANSNCFSLMTTFDTAPNKLFASSTVSFQLVPGTGFHYLRHKGAWIQLVRNREARGGDASGAAPFETITLKTLAWNAGLFSSMLQGALAANLSKQVGLTNVYAAVGHQWTPFGRPKSVRSLASVILDEGISQNVLSDLELFLDSKAWYAEKGIPYRRGYLFSGPPGTGKTSFILALAGAKGYGVAVVNLQDACMTDERLSHLLAHLPPQTIALIEDIDVAVSSERASSVERSNRVTFSGLLNALDGAASSEDLIVCMTTNKPSALPPVLVRPGRVDVTVTLDLASEYQIKRLFQQFFSQASDLQCANFAHVLHGVPVSPAEIQGFLLYYKDNPEACLRDAPKFGAHLRRSRRVKTHTDSGAKNVESSSPNWSHNETQSHEGTHSPNDYRSTSTFQSHPVDQPLNNVQGISERKQMGSADNTTSPRVSAEHADATSAAPVSLDSVGSVDYTPLHRMILGRDRLQIIAPFILTGSESTSLYSGWTRRHLFETLRIVFPDLPPADEPVVWRALIAFRQPFRARAVAGLAGLKDSNPLEYLKGLFESHPEWRAKHNTTKSSSSLAEIWNLRAALAPYDGNSNHLETRQTRFHTHMRISHLIAYLNAAGPKASQQDAEKVLLRLSRIRETIRIQALEEAVRVKPNDVAGYLLEHFIVPHNRGPTRSSNPRADTKSAKGTVSDRANKPRDRAAPSEVVAKPHEVIAKPSEVIAKPHEVVAKPSEVVAKPHEVLAESNGADAASSECVDSSRARSNASHAQQSPAA